MIIDAVVHIVLGLLTGIFGLLPAFSLGGGVLEAGEQLGASLAGINGVVPVGTLGGALAAVLSARVFLLAWDVLVWIYDKFPFKAT